MREEEATYWNPVVFNDSSPLLVSPSRHGGGGVCVIRQVARPAWQGCGEPRSKAEMRTDWMCVVWGVGCRAPEVRAGHDRALCACQE